jgi:hypothetical protein
MATRARRPVAATMQVVRDRLGHEREERGGRKGRVVVQVRASRANRVGMT